MSWTDTKRVWKSGAQSFMRNGFVTFSSVVIMTITLFIISSTLLFGGLLGYSLNQVKSKIDISVYFTTNAQEQDILTVKKSLEALPEVSYVEYISSDQALQNFKDRNQGDQLTLQALDELGTNPLGASLNIKAKDPSQYEGIANFLQSDNNEFLSASGTKIIDSVNYSNNKLVIERATKIINSVNSIGLWLGIIFILISIIIVFNTIRLSIFMSRDEISVMRLVGASRKYIKWPFAVNGILCGIIAAFIVTVVFALGTFFINKYYGTYFVGFDIFNYFMGNFFKIIGILFGSGIILGAIASYLAVHKYLKD
jgi:cell division transport system permease protein